MEREKWIGDATLEALRRLGRSLGEDLLGQVVASFLTEGRRGLATLRGALAAGDAATLATAAHSLAGAAAMLRAFALESCCAELETRARQGDLAAAGALVPVVAGSYTRVAAGLAASAGEALFKSRPTVAQGEEGRLDPVGRAKLAKDVGEMGAHRRLRDVEAPGDLRVGKPLGDQP